MKWGILEEKNQVTYCRKCGQKVWIYWHKDKLEKKLCANHYFKRI